MIRTGASRSECSGVGWRARKAERVGHRRPRSEERLPTDPQTIFEVVGVACLALALGACAIANTPQQDLAYERWARCNSPFVQLDRVDVDGRISFMFSNSSTRQEVLQCLAEAGRAGPALPEPRAVRPPGGP